jgi:catechol 2,3-dioxygenase-like lactoylglutathione lyase family enzyme
MSTTDDRTGDASAGNVDMKLEVVTIPVTDLDRAKAFYAGLGWRLDADFLLGGARAIQFTPPGSGCSIHFSIIAVPPGSAQGLFLIVSDLNAAREELTGHGVEVSEPFHLTPDGSAEGPAPDHGTYNSYVRFSDPDGNGWLVQEVTSRLPGRIDPGATTYMSATDLASALRRAAAAHGEHEKRTGEADENWPDWYAAYMVSEQEGSEPPK